MIDVHTITQEAESKMQNALESLANKFTRLRTGRAHIGILENIFFEYYGSSTPLAQAANLSIIDSRTLGVSPWDKKVIPNIEKAIRESDLGLNPAVQGEIIRIPVPALNEERRLKLVKVVKGESEDAKIEIRNARRDANDQLKKAVKEKHLSEDDERRGNDEVQKITDRFVAEVDKRLLAKETEIMTV